MITLQTQVYREREIVYTGEELSPHWIYKRFGITGDAVVAFVGGADVKVQKMVDLHDVTANAPIYSPKMLHFLGEFFIESLSEGIYLQNLFVMQVYCALLERGISRLKRRGNDLYFKDRKLSVSIATKSVVSVLFHFGINIRTEGCPVPAAGLREMGVLPFPFAHLVLQKTYQDFMGFKISRAKVLSR